MVPVQAPHPPQPTGSRLGGAAGVSHHLIRYQRGRCAKAHALGEPLHSALLRRAFYVTSMTVAPLAPVMIRSIACYASALETYVSLVASVS